MIFQLHTGPLAGGETIRLDCSAVPEQYNDLGEGMRQNLLGTCRVDGASGVRIDGTRSPRLLTFQPLHRRPYGGCPILTGK
jgi:hypothetical protein